MSDRAEALAVAERLDRLGMADTSDVVRDLVRRLESLATEKAELERQRDAEDWMRNWCANNCEQIFERRRHAPNCPVNDLALAAAPETEGK